MEAFENSLLCRLREVDPREVLGTGDDGPDEVMALSGELAAVEAKIAELEAELLNGDVAALARVLRQRESRKAELARQLAQARRKAASPLGEAWAEAHTLLDAVSNAPDPEGARLRLRSAVRRIVSGVWLLVVPRGAHRLAAVQVHFAGGARRDYLIHVKGGGNHRKGGCRVASLADAVPAAAQDLRDRAAAARLAEDLGRLNVTALWDAMK